ADVGRGPNLAVERAVVGEDVEMVAAGGAAGECQLGQAGDCADVDRLSGEVGPDGIERLEPGKQVGVLGDDAGEALVEVVVGIDQAGQDDVVAQVEHNVGRGRQRLGGADGFDDVVADEQT